jgi:hypothetical protein
VQSQFVDDPKGTVSRADSLVNEVMQVRGYPVGDFDQRAADISVDHPVVVENYRAAHDIALRHARGQASTQDLRTAVQEGRPKPVQSERTAGVAGGMTATSKDPETTPLFPNNELEELRNRWKGIQAAFVDEPRRAVEQADGLVASAMKRLAEVFNPGTI